MVCPRCIMAVQQVMDKLDIPVIEVELGRVLMPDPLSPQKEDELSKALTAIGFSIIGNRKTQLIEQIKNLIIDNIHHKEGDLQVVWSSLLAEQTHHEYKYLSTLFSSVEGVTIEQYIILQKIEKAKELLIYDELTLSEISYQLGYSSVAYLSSQFKHVTGMTPTTFKKSMHHHRKSLDDI